MLLSPRDGLIPKIKQQFKQGNCHFYELFGLDALPGAGGGKLVEGGAVVDEAHAVGGDGAVDAEDALGIYKKTLPLI